MLNHRLTMLGELEQETVWSTYEIRIHDSEESKKSIYLAILKIIWLHVSKQRLAGTM